MTTLSEAFEECRLLNKHYGTPYLHAINYFPKQLQPHIHGLCAFERIVHEMLFNPNDGISRTKQIKSVKAWQKAFKDGLRHSGNGNPYLQAVIHTTVVFDLPLKPFDKFIAAKINDHARDHYDSYSQLTKHIDSTTGAIADQICRILELNGKHKKTALKLTSNAALIQILFDAGKDFHKRNKCYLPKKDLKKFGYNISDLKERQLNEAWKNFMEHYLAKAEKELQYANKQIESLPESARLALETMAESYDSLINSMRKQDYDIFSRQPRLGLGIKVRHFIPSLGSLIR